MSPGVKGVVAFRDGVHHAVRTGIRLGFHGRSAGLALFATQRGGFGGSSFPSAIRAYYLLAEGETWNVSKDGVVTITR